MRCAASTRTSADIPSAWGQVCPRSVRLAPEGLLVPAATLRVMLRRQGALSILYAGFGLEPVILDGETVTVVSITQPRVGDLILCEREGWGDLLRARRRFGDGAWIVALDAFPRRRVIVGAEQVLGVVSDRSGGRAWRLTRRAAVTLGLGALRFACRRIERASFFGEQATQSVGDKYRDQVADYSAMRGSNLDEGHIGLLRRHVPPGGSVLVAGCGAGGEVVHLARLGWRVTAFDLLPEMVSAARSVVSEAGVEAEFLVADARMLDLEERRFDAAYLTPLLYSFIAQRAARIAMLQRVRRHLVSGGGLLFSVQLRRSPADRLQTTLAWVRHRVAGAGGFERGDWYTWFLTSSGRIGYSFLHKFSPGDVAAETRDAGFGSVQRVGAHFLVS